MEEAVKNIRQVVAKRLGVLRILQAFQNTETKVDINEIARRTKIPYETVEKYLETFISYNIINPEYKINPASAYFMGIRTSLNILEISVVGLDGKSLDLKQVCEELKINPKCLDNYELDYSSHGISRLARLIKDFINDLKPVYPIKAVCFSFDDTDYGDKAFATTNYFKMSFIRSYPFNKICDLCFKELEEETMFFLDNTSACYALSKEYPCLKQDGNKLYMNLTQTGCFVTPIVDNKLQYGYKLQTINLTGLMEDGEKQALLSNRPKRTEFTRILEKLLAPFIISIAPITFTIGTNLLYERTEIFDNFFEQIPYLYGNIFKTSYSPKYQVEVLPKISNGTAISAMYQYYEWGLDFI